MNKMKLTKLETKINPRKFRTNPQMSFSEESARTGRQWIAAAIESIEGAAVCALKRIRNQNKKVERANTNEQESGGGVFLQKLCAEALHSSGLRLGMDVMRDANCNCANVAL